MTVFTRLIRILTNHDRAAVLPQDGRAEDIANLSRDVNRVTVRVRDRDLDQRIFEEESQVFESWALARVVRALLERIAQDGERNSGSDRMGDGVSGRWICSYLACQLITFHL